MTKIKLKNREIQQIKDLALKMFHRTPEFPDLDIKEIQTACILMGLDQLLTSKGLNVPFEVELVERGDCDPVEDFGGSNEEM